MGEKFIITGPGRCGSTMLFYALKSHPAITCYSEVLKKSHLKKSQMSYKKRHDIIFKNNKTAGCKLFYHHLPKDSKKWDWFVDNSIVFNLIRQDTIEWYTSLIISSYGIRNIYNEKERPELKKRWVRIDIKKMKHSILDYQASVNWARDKYSHYYEVSYSDLVHKWNFVMKRMQKLLKVPYYELKQKTVKLNKEPLSDLIINYDEVLDAAKNFPLFIETDKKFSL